MNPGRWLRRRSPALATALLLAAPLSARADEPPKPAEASASAPTNEELARRIEALTQELESLKLGEVAAPAEKPAAEAGKTEGSPAPEKTTVFGLGPGASKVYRVKSGLSIGGYGESVYQNFDAQTDSGAASGKTNEWDYLRAVLYVGWKFSPKFVLNTEIEYEHGSTGKGGEVSVEFATLDWLARKEVAVRAGLVLAPVGLVNEMHEPPTFLGARRPDVETAVLPSTWRMGGLGALGEVGPVAYKLYVVESLYAKGFTASTGIRGGRQSGAKAKADDLAVTGRVDLVSVPGLLAGVSLFTGDTGQDLSVGGVEVDARTTTFDVHAEYRIGGLWLRGLWATVSVDDADLVNQANGFTGSKSVGERIEGWYLQAGYDVGPLVTGKRSIALTPFARYEELDTQKEVPDGYARDGANDRRIWTLGLDFKPLPQVSVKVDYQDYRNAAGSGVDQWNVALGYLF